MPPAITSTDAEGFMIARVAAVAALAAAIAVVVIVLLGGSGTYTLHADFTDAGGLVTGNDVLMGPAKVGSGAVDLAHAPTARRRSRWRSTQARRRCTRARWRGSTRTRCLESPTSYVVLEPGPE